MRSLFIVGVLLPVDSLEKQTGAKQRSAVDGAKRISATERNQYQFKCTLYI